MPRRRTLTGRIERDRRKAIYHRNIMGKTGKERAAKFRQNLKLDSEKHQLFKENDRRRKKAQAMDKQNETEESIKERREKDRIRQQNYRKKKALTKAGLEGILIKEEAPNYNEGYEGSSDLVNSSCGNTNDEFLDRENILTDPLDVSVKVEEYLIKQEINSDDECLQNKSQTNPMESQASLNELGESSRLNIVPKQEMLDENEDYNFSQMFFSMYNKLNPEQKLFAKFEVLKILKTAESYQPPSNV